MSEIAKALGTISDKWGPWSHVDWRLLGKMQSEGLIEIRGYPLPTDIRRTDAGRAVVAQSPAAAPLDGEDRG